MFTPSKKLRYKLARPRVMLSLAGTVASLIVWLGFLWRLVSAVRTGDGSGVEMGLFGTVLLPGLILLFFLQYRQSLRDLRSKNRQRSH
jgi:crotonobetainyl-CoA:carnitine CoA-transferase CaiB-like acyl-CoA transferase